MTPVLATPDATASVLIALGLGTLLGPWWLQLGWVALAVVVETWHRLDPRHDDGW